MPHTDLELCISTLLKGTRQLRRLAQKIVVFMKSVFHHNGGTQKPELSKVSSAHWWKIGAFPFGSPISRVLRRQRASKGSFERRVRGASKGERRASKPPFLKGL